jgi:glycosyltransferase involved in cell wall biosynthesis/SAM-dependent methyltransferase
LIERIPKDLISNFAEIFIIDDSSSDSTFEVADRIIKKYSRLNITAYRTPFNRGYGGNQKLGYLYCIEKGHDIVVLLHGDGQYAPEYLPRVLAAFSEKPDAVFASRMLHKNQALEGGMPLYKWMGNQVLTNFENRLLKANLSEFHTGFRAYSVDALKKIPFAFNSDDFHFDTEIIIQALATRWSIKEVSIPAYYGDEICHVNGFKYAFNCIRSVLSYHLVNLGIFYRRNFDFGLFETDNYIFKKSPYSLHQHVIQTAGFHPGMTSIELGANRGILSQQVAENVSQHLAIDQIEPDLAGKSEKLALDLNGSFGSQVPRRQYDLCISLDVIEHLNEPEHFLLEVFDLLKTNSKLFISTANICYLPMRFSMLFGQFNYGKRGILDRTHKRLFSVSSFQKLITQYGFKIESVKGFPPPFTDLISDSFLMRKFEGFHAFLSHHFPNLFAYNFLIVATRMDGIEDIFKQTTATMKAAGSQ